MMIKLFLKGVESIVAGYQSEFYFYKMYINCLSVSIDDKNFSIVEKLNSNGQFHVY